jgi:hypothetical protein
MQTPFALVHHAQGQSSATTKGHYAGKTVTSSSSPTFCAINKGNKERSLITKHLKNIYETRELDEKSNVQKM